MRRLPLLAVLAAALAFPAGAQAGSLVCTGDPGQANRLDLNVGGEAAYGSFVAPAAAPSVLVVFAHGYSHNVDGWRDHMKREAKRLGVLAVAMNYRGLTDLPARPDGYQRSRGWPVLKGGADLNAAALNALATCPSIKHVILYGVSMGANASGMALAAKPKRPGGKPLYDLWIAVEGVHNLTTLYYGARLVAPTNKFAAEAKEDIEIETGGTPETANAAYTARTNTLRGADIGGAGLKGAILVHGRDDGLAPYSFSQEMTRVLRGQNVETDFFTVASRRADDDPDTSLSGGPGHGSEISQRHIVIDTGFDRLAAIVARSEPPPCDRDFIVEGRDDTVSPNPAQPASGCPKGPMFAGATPPAGGSAGSATTAPALCSPRRATIRHIRGRYVRDRKLRITGRARPSTCAGGGAMKAQVAVYRRAGKRCRFYQPGGKLTRPRSCSTPRWLKPRGAKSFSLNLRRRPRGRIVAVARVTDKRGASRIARRRAR